MIVTKVSKREWWFYEGFIFSVVGIGIIISGIINRDYSSLIIGMVLALIGAFSFFVGWQKLKWFREINKLGIYPVTRIPCPVVYAPAANGSRAIFRARLMASDSARWCVEQVPVRRRGRILPRSATNSLTKRTSL